MGARSFPCRVCLTLPRRVGIWRRSALPRAIRRAGHPPRRELRRLFDSALRGARGRMTVKVTDAQTNDVPSGEYNTMRNNNISSYRFRLQDISGLTNLNVSIALHKSRFVEFTAKPEKAAAAQ